MNLDLYQVDAFAKRRFEGNPAAVCPLEHWLDDALMQSFANENNLAETAFFVKEESGYRIRWFTPEVEVDLCGHATLAAAYVLFEEQGYPAGEISFESNSGALKIRKYSDALELDFPAQPASACTAPAGIEEALGATVIETYFNEDLLVVVADEATVVNLSPDFRKLSLIDARGVIVTGPSEDFDFVNRFFGPRVGIDEDSVTGSAFTKLVPYWAERLSTNSMTAKQVSARGGEVGCLLEGERVRLRGQAVLYMKGSITI